MKKLLIVFIALVTAIGPFAFSACDTAGNGTVDDGTRQTTETGVKGTIDGSYAEISAEDYDGILSKLDGAMPAAEDAETAGGTAKAEGEFKLTVGGKTLTLKGDGALSLILETAKFEDGLDAVKGAAASGKMRLTADDGFSTEVWGIVGPLAFGDEYPELSAAMEQEETGTAVTILTALDNADVNAEFRGYVKDAEIYTDTKVTGVPEKIKGLVPEDMGIDFDALANGLKYALTQEDVETLLSSMIAKILGLDGNTAYGFNGLSVYDEGDGEENGETEFARICDLLELKLYAETTDGGTKLKLSTTSETGAAVKTLIKSEMSDETAEIITDLDITKLNAEIYLTLDADNVITAVAGNADVAASATVAGQTVGATFNGRLDCSFAVPESIEYPSFEGYERLSGGEENAAA